MAEFPDAGAHCDVPECRQLDLLPIKCDLCSRILCKDHRTYESHRCAEAYKKDLRVPICPLCQQPVPVKKNEIPDVIVSKHIDKNCCSDLAAKNRLAPRCGVRGCLKRELVTMNCNQCKIHFCLTHRHTADHKCKGKATAETSTENDIALARALDESLHVEPQMDSERLNFLMAQQLQQEEYERAYGVNQLTNSTNGTTHSNTNCCIS